MKKVISVLLSFLILLITSSCGSETKKSTKKEKTKKNRIESIIVNSFDSQQIFKFKYNNDHSVNVEIASKQASFSIHIDYNEDRKVTEMISGAGRIQNIYGPEGRRVGSIVISENSQVEFEYDQSGNLIRQLNLAGNDTLAKYTYKYENGEDPQAVIFKDEDGNKRIYTLKFDTEENLVRNKFEMLYPQEDIYWLGIAALYGKHNLLEATLISKEEGKNAEVHLGTYSPGNIKYRFIKNDDGSFLIKSLSDGTREWTAQIKYE